MPNIITSANFIGDIMLPNVAGSGAQASQLTTFITKYEAEYLKRILGYDLYVLYVAGITALDADYEAIRDGATYTGDDDLTYEWEGLAGVGKSPIANYIYYKVMEYNASQTQGVGETMSAVENGTRAVPKVKMVAAWNQMVEWNYHLHRYLYENRATFPDYIGLTYTPVLSASWYSTLPINYELFIHINTFGI